MDGARKLNGNIKPIELNDIALKKNYMKIKLYTIKGCKACIKVKMYLEENNIKYEEVDGDKNLEETLSIMDLARSNELPIIQYDDNHFIVGYDQENLDKLKNLYS